MKVNHKDKSLAKKVLLSVVAAGVMSGFVLSAEAADGIIHEDGKSYQYDAVDAERVNANNASVIELNGGKVTGVKVEHQDKDDDRVGYADEAAASDKNSKIIANDVAFTGEVRAGEGGTVILNGGSVTSGTFYYTDAQGAGPIEDYSTEIGSRGEGSYVELNKVKIDSNLGAFEGGVLTVNDSNVNADTAIYAEGGTINLNSTDGKAKYVVGNYGVEARDGGVININGGGTFASDSNLYCLPMQAFDGSEINVDSGKNKTTIKAVVKLFGSQMNVTGDVEIVDDEVTGDVSVETSNAGNGSTFTVNKGSKLTTNAIGVTGKGSSFTANGSVVTKGFWVNSGASVTLNGGGKVTGLEQISTGGEIVDKFNLAAIVRDQSTLTATDFDFTGDLKAVSGSKIILKGGSVTASDYYVNGEKDGYTEFGAVGEDSSIEADGVDIKSATMALDGAKVTIKNSNINTAEGIWSWGKGSEIILDGTEDNVYTVVESIVAQDGSKIYINGGILKDNNLKSKMFDIEADDEIINTDAKGIVLDNNGVISTMSDQIYANAASATEKNSGEITNEGIDFKGGKLVLNDAKYTLSYTNSAQAELKKQGATKLTMTGELIDESTGEVKDTMSVDKVADNAGSDVELDKTTATTDNNLLVGATGDNSDGTDKVENGFAVGSLDLGKGADTVTITNDKEVTLGGSKGGDIITVNGTAAKVDVVVGTNTQLDGTTATNGILTIGNSLATADTQYKLNGNVTVNAESTLNVNGKTEITDSVNLKSGTINVSNGSTLNTSEINIDGRCIAW